MKPPSKNAVGIFIVILVVFLAACSRPRPRPVVVITPPPTPTTAVTPTFDVEDVGIIIPTPLPDDTAPTATPQATETAVALSCGPPDTWEPYIVQPLDTLTSLSIITNVSIAEIKDANCMLNDEIIVGEVLYLPPLPPPPPPVPIIVPVVGGDDGDETCSSFGCPTPELGEQILALGDTNKNYFPCDDTTQAFPWISTQTEDDEDGNGVLIPGRNDLVLGERGYYYVCTDDEAALPATAEITGPNNYSASATLLTTVPNPERELGKAKRAFVFNAVCDLTPGSYTLTVTDTQNRVASLSFNVDNDNSPHVLITPLQQAPPGADFTVHFCNYTANSDLTADLFHEIEYIPVGNKYRIGHNRSWVVQINGDGHGSLDLESLPKDSRHLYVMADRFVLGEIITSLASDVLWLGP